jgi:hypothetical protein
VTSGHSRAPLPAYPLTLPLLRAGLGEITTSSGARQLSISHTTALPAAYALRAARGRCRQETFRHSVHRRGFGACAATISATASAATASAALGMPGTSAAALAVMDHDPAGAPGLISGGVDLDPAAKWISTIPPLKTSRTTSLTSKANGI